MKRLFRIILFIVALPIVLITNTATYAREVGKHDSRAGRFGPLGCLIPTLVISTVFWAALWLIALSLVRRYLLD
jgi:hypothetical protein